MSIKTQQYNPDNLQENEFRSLQYVFRNEKAAKILRLLLKQDSQYLNEIQSKVGGSKTNTMQILGALERQDLIKNEWKMVEMGTGQQRAVKSFQVNENKQDLVIHYSRFLTSS